MKQLNVRFSETQRLKLSDIATTLNMNDSDIARAALYIGLNEITSMASKDTDRGIEFASLNAVKAK
jgi:hypothetical protein